MSTEVKEFAIVKAIMKALKLDEAGKISKFISQEIKAAKENIEGLEINLQVIALKRKQEVAKSDKAIEDAKDAVEAAYQNITPENVINNAAMTAYSAEFWRNVNYAEQALEQLEKEVEEATKLHDAKVKELESQIGKYKARIAKISKVA